MTIIYLRDLEYKELSETMKIDQEYDFVNVCPSPIQIVHAETLPAVETQGVVYECHGPNNSETLTFDGTIKIWAKSVFNTGKVSIYKKDHRVALVPDPRTNLMLPFHTTSNQTTLAVASVIGSRDITVVSPTGIIAGSYILMFSIVTNRFFKGYATGVLGSVVTLDSPMDSVMPIGANVDIGSTELNVNGAVTPVVFGIRSITPGIPSTADVYRIMFQMTLDAAPNFHFFGDRARLDNGIILRSRNGVTQNLFNIKANSEFSLLTGDYTPYSTSSPSIGVFGIGVRMTFSGDSKMGSVIRVGQGEDLELVVQDDLTTLGSFSIWIQGNIFNPLN